jgi:hypothetical protein
MITHSGTNDSMATSKVLALLAMGLSTVQAVGLTFIFLHEDLSILVPFKSPAWFAHQNILLPSKLRLSHSSV